MTRKTKGRVPPIAQDDTRVAGKPLVRALDIAGAVESGFGMLIQSFSLRENCSLSGNRSTATRSRGEIGRFSLVRNESSVFGG